MQLTNKRAFNILSFGGIVQKVSLLQHPICKKKTLNILTCFVLLAMKVQMTVFFSMALVGVYQASRTTICPMITSMSLRGISTHWESPETAEENIWVKRPLLGLLETDVIILCIKVFIIPHNLQSLLSKKLQEGHVHTPWALLREKHSSKRWNNNSCKKKKVYYVLEHTTYVLCQDKIKDRKTQSIAIIFVCFLKRKNVFLY